MNKQYIITGLLGITILFLLFLGVKYHEFRKLKSSNAIETYNLLSVSVGVLSYFDEEWQNRGVDGLIHDINEYSHDNGVDYFTDVITYLEKNKNYLHAMHVSDSNALLIYHIGFNQFDDKLRKGYVDYASIKFFDYIFKRDGDIIVTYLKDYED